MRSKAKLFSVLAVIFIIGGGWGFLVHKTINQLAIYQLPKAMQPFFFTNMDSLVGNAPRPDQRRFTDPTEGNKHFMDMEYYGSDPFKAVPHDWNEAVAKYSADTLRKYGTLPYTLVTTQQKLVNAFRSSNKDSIIFYATDLGHYIGDAHVPLHTSINYDGQLTGQQGLHDLWETTVPETVLDKYSVKTKHKAKYLPSVSDAAWAILEHTHSLLGEMFKQEKEVSKNFTDSDKYHWEVRWGKNRRFYTPAFAAEYDKALKGSINAQMIRASEALADFWYTAWVDAGKPDLSKMLDKPYDKQKFKREQKAVRKNQLQRKGWLISQNTRTKD
ncbi:MAG: zinc dependent phospholipase C family protein [Niabella sp.]